MLCNPRHNIARVHVELQTVYPAKAHDQGKERKTFPQSIQGFNQAGELVDHRTFCICVPRRDNLNL